MIATAAIVDAAVRAAGIPIDGVSIGVDGDRTTWAVAFQPAATAAQRSTAATILATLVVDDAAQRAVDRRVAQLGVDNLSLFEKAILLTLVDQINLVRAALPIPLPALTPAQVLTAIKTKASTLS
jgi:hypothetical protein